MSKNFETNLLGRRAAGDHLGDRMLGEIIGVELDETSDIAVYIANDADGNVGYYERGSFCLMTDALEHRLARGDVRLADLFPDCETPDDSEAS